MIVYTFALADGTTLERELDPRVDDLPDGYESPPAWLENPSRAWPHPQGPITFTGRVRAGAENEARAWLGLPTVAEPA